MKAIRFTSRAERDMRSVVRYYEDMGAGLSVPIVADVRECIERLRQYPNIGIRSGVPGVRRVLSRRYRYKIAYRIRRDTIEIVGIFRYQNRAI